MGTLRAFKDSIAIGVFGMTATEAIEQGVCIDCLRPALEHCSSDAGRREYQISGLCEECFDRITKG